MTDGEKEILENALELAGLPVRFRDDLRLWIIRHGIEAVAFFPRLRERKHWDYRGPITPAIADEYAAIQRYFREEAQAAQDMEWTMKRAGEKYLFAVTELRKPRTARKQRV